MQATAVSDYTNLVEQIRSILRSSGDPDEAVLVQIHGQLSDAIKSANERLKEIEELLHEGHRSEAVQRAEVAPNLLELVAVLDFPELPIWLDYTRQFELPDPLGIQVDIAAELNFAYAAENSIEELLVQQRLLALGKAPIRQRLRILREVANRDPENAIWREDIKLFEQARLREVEQRISQPFDASHLSYLENLESELESAVWLETHKASSLLGKVTVLTQNARQQDCRTELEQLEKQILEAYDKEDLSTAIEHCTRWKAVMQLGDLDAKERESEELNSAFEWVEFSQTEVRHNEEFQATLAAIEFELDQGKNPDQLRQLVSRLNQFDRNVPTALELRIEQYFHEQESVRKSKRRRLVLMAVASIVILFSAVGWVFWSTMERNKINNWIAEIPTNATPENASQPVEEIIKLPAGYESQRRLKTAMDDFRAKQQIELARIQEWRQQVDSAKTLMESAKSKQDLTVIYGFLEEAELLAVHPNEKTEIKNVQTELATRKSKLINSVSDSFRLQVKDLNERINSEGVGDKSKVDLFISEAEALVNRNDVIPEVREPVRTGTLAKLRQAMIQIESRNRRKEFVARASQAIPNRFEFEKVLKDFQKVSDSSDSNNIKYILEKESDLWVDFSDWDRYCSLLGELDIANISVTEAKLMEQKYQTFLSQYGDLPAVATFGDFLVATRKISNREDDTGGLAFISFMKTLESPFFRSASQLVTRQGKRYYFIFERDKNPSQSATKLWISHGNPGLGPEDKLPFVEFDKSDISNTVSEENDSASNWVSTHSDYSKKAFQLFDSLKGNNGTGWYKCFDILASNLLKTKYDQIDPRLRLELSKTIFNLGAQGSWLFDQKYQNHINYLKTLTFNYGDDWLEPCNPEENHDCELAKNYLSNLKSQETSDPMLAWDSFVTANQFRKSYRWIGMLVREGAHWKLVAQDQFKANKSGRLFCRLIDANQKNSKGEPGKTIMSPIGELQKGTTTIQETIFDAREFRPVYLEEFLTGDPS